MSLLIVGTCGAVAYNVLLRQDPKHKLPGSTAVHVQVKDIEVAGVSRDNNTSSIGQLLARTQPPARTVKFRALTASIQDQLAYLGFYKGSVDGQSGPQTLFAIKQYQQQNSLRQTGQVSRKLLDHLKFTRKISDAGKITGSIKTDNVADSEIRKVQERLVLFGYQPGKLDGVLGNATTKAIRQFETDRSLPVTGKITSRLLQELGN